MFDDLIKKMKIDKEGHYYQALDQVKENFYKYYSRKPSNAELRKIVEKLRKEYK